MIFKNKSLNSWCERLNQVSQEMLFGGCLVAMAFLFSLQLALTGVPAQDVFGHDTIVLFDGGWRVFNGLKPSVDFYSPLGPVTYLFVALGYWLFGVNVEALADMEAISLPVVMALVWYSLKTRLPRFWLFWSAVLLGLCLTAQHPLRQEFWRTGYAMLYNRLGYGGVMLLGLLLFSPQGTASKIRLGLNSVQAGAILSILFFIKVSFFIGALPLLLGFLFRNVPEIDRTILICILRGGRRQGLLKLPHLLAACIGSKEKHNRYPHEYENNK